MNHPTVRVDVERRRTGALAAVALEIDEQASVPVQGAERLGDGGEQDVGRSGCGRARGPREEQARLGAVESATTTARGDAIGRLASRSSGEGAHGGPRRCDPSTPPRARTWAGRRVLVEALGPATKRGGLRRQRRAPRAAAQARSRSSRRMRQDTPSTARWWMTRRRRAAHPSPDRRAARRIGPRRDRGSPARSAAAVDRRAPSRASRTTRGDRRRDGRRPRVGMPRVPALARTRGGARRGARGARDRRCSTARPSSESLASRKYDWLWWLGSGCSRSRHQRCTGVSGTAPTTGPSRRGGALGLRPPRRRARRRSGAGRSAAA